MTFKKVGIEEATWHLGKAPGKGFTSEKAGASGAFKKSKKKFDLTLPIFNVTQRVQQPAVTKDVR
jgi:hypothetical protein